MKVATRVKILATLSVAISMATATKGKAGDRDPNRIEARVSANEPVFVKIDQAIRANPYFKSGLRVGLAAGRDRGSLLSCRDAALSEDVDIEVEDLNQEPYMLGYLKGFIPAYEESRQLVLSQCIKDVPVESEADISYASARLAKVKDIMSSSLQHYQQSGCGFDGTDTYCSETGYQEITKNYFALVWYVSGPGFVTQVNQNIDSINKANTGLVKAKNKKVLDQIKGLIQKPEPSDNDIDKIKELANTLNKSEKANSISPLKNPYE